MTVQEREKAIRAVVALGRELAMGASSSALAEAVEAASQRNQWFIPRYTYKAIEAWATQLEENNLRAWLQQYPLPQEASRVGLILAGNLPLVGLHDILAGYLSGHTLLIKPSSQDTVLVQYAINVLSAAEPDMADRLQLVSSLKGVDAVVATGSDNTARYFEYYFKNIPSVIRHSRTSVAVVPDDVSDEELSLLADDVMMYWGRGCRSVSRVFLPKDFDIIRLIKALEKYSYVADYHYYRNNYDYQRAIYTVSAMAGVYDTGFVLLSPEDKLFLPTAVIGYSFYDEISSVKEYLSSVGEHIQCAVGRTEDGFLPMGTAQCPALVDYADGVDTMKFFSSLKKDIC